MELNLKIDPEFQEVIPAISQDEFAQLEENIVTQGIVFSPIITWGGYILDGHSRYRIVQSHPDIECRTYELILNDRYEAIAWICKNQIGTRNLPERYVRYLRGKQYDAEKKVCKFYGNQYTLPGKSGLGEKRPDQNAHGTRSEIAKRNGVTEHEVKVSQQFSRALDLADEVLPGIKKEVLNEQIHPTDAAIYNVARVPIEKRKEAAEKLRDNTDKRKLPKGKDQKHHVDHIPTDAEMDSVVPVSEDDILNSMKAAVNDLIDLCNNYFSHFPKLLSDEQYHIKTVETLKEFQKYISTIERK